MDERTRTTGDGLRSDHPASDDESAELARDYRQPAAAPHSKTGGDKTDSNKTVGKPGSKRRVSKVRLGIGLVIAIGLAFVGYRLVTAVQAPPRIRHFVGGVQAVGASTAALNNVPIVVDALGTVTPLITVTVQSQISGYLTKVGFKEGQLVHKGDFLAQIDPRPYEILKAQYQGQLERDQGLLSQARMDLKRYQTLAKQNSIARQQAEDQAFVVQQDEGTVKQDQALIAGQALNIAYCRIVAPVTGRIGLRLVDPGNYVQASSATGIAVVTQMQPISVLFSIPEDDLPELMPQIESGAQLKLTAFDRSNRNKLAVGKVSSVDNQIDTSTGTVKLRAEFDNADSALFPNQFVNVELLVKTLQNAVSVPTAAIQRGAPGATPGGALGTYVYLVNPNGTVSVRQVTTGPGFVGPNNVSMTAIQSGLSRGDRVVTDGTDRLRDGMRVNVTELDGKPVAPAPAGAALAKGGVRGASARARRRHRRR